MKRESLIGEWIFALQGGADGLKILSNLRSGDAFAKARDRAHAGRLPSVLGGINRAGDPEIHVLRRSANGGGEAHGEIESGRQNADDGESVALGFTGWDAE